MRKREIERAIKIVFFQHSLPKKNNKLKSTRDAMKMKADEKEKLRNYS